MVPVFGARSLPLLALFVAVATAAPLNEGCDCEATCAEIVARQREEIARLREEVRTLRGNMDTAARRAEARLSCDRDWWVTTDSEVEEFRLEGCSAVKTLMIGDCDRGGNFNITSLAGLSSLETAENVKICYSELVSLAGLDNLRHVEKMLQLVFNLKLVSLDGLRSLETAGAVDFFRNDALQSLAGLESLVRIGGLLQLRANFDLRSLTGLEGLETAGAVTIWQQQELHSLTGLENLARIEEGLTIWSTSLRSLVGLQGLTTAGTVDISFNFDELQSLTGLENLTRVKGELVMKSNWGLKSIAGLQRLESAGEITLLDSSLLESLTGLESLTQVGKLTLEGLAALRSVAALRSLTSVWSGGIFIFYCSLLHSLEGLGTLRVSQLQVVFSPLEYLGGPLAQGSSVHALSIDGASWPRCVTPHERMSLLSAVEDVQASSVPNATWPQACGTNFGTFSCTKGQPCIVSLAGEESNYTSVFVSARFTGCGACSVNHPQGDVADGGVVDFAYALKNEEAGLHSICRCAGGIGPVAQLLLRGPRWSVAKTCSRGRNCSFGLEGEALERTDRVVLMSSCSNSRPSSGFAADWTADGAYLLHGSAWYAAPPTQYQVCWRAPCTSAPDGPTCPAPEDSYIQVGEVDLLGAYPRDYAPLLGAEVSFSVPNIGLGVSDGDRMRLRRACGEADEEGAYVLAANSSGMVFDFGRLTEDRVEAGRHSLCWCQERDGAQCNASWHFRADAGAVQIQCPAGQGLVDSRRCEICPAGKRQPVPGLDPCVECPTGQFSRSGQEMCEDCPVGEVASLTGSSACVRCLAWQSADADAASCSPDPVLLVLLALFYLSVAAFCAILVHGMKRRLSVGDVSLVQDQTIVTTCRSHGLTNFGRPSFPVALRGTGHPGLDSPAEPFQARVVDAVRLELLTQGDQSISSCRLDTSMGTLTVTFPHDLGHQRIVALGLPVLFLAVAAFGGLALFANLIAEALLGAAAVALTSVAAMVALRWWPPTTPLQVRLSEFAQKLQHSHKPRSVDKGPNRAIAIGKLHELLEFFHDFIRDRTAYYLDSNVLQPLTRAEKVSYAELVGAEQVEWFVSHFWGTSFEHFCTALRKHAEMVCGGRSWTTLRYWVCFCSNNQYQIRDELGGEAGWRESSFYLTLRSGKCLGTCMVLDDKALPLTRVWCIFELLQTVKLERDNAAFQGLVLCTSGGVLNNGGGSAEVAMALAEKVAGMNLQTAQATSQKDASMIRAQVIEEMGSFTALNRFICHQMRDMLTRAQQHANQHFVAVFAHLDQTIIANTLENEEAPYMARV